MVPKRDTDVIADVATSIVGYGGDLIQDGATTATSTATSTDTAMKQKDGNPEATISDLIHYELRPFLEVAVPSVLLQIGFMLPPFTIASTIGREFGSLHLSGFSLANLTGNICSLSLLAGLYSACETLAPQSFGAGNYREVGLLAMRGFFVSLVVLATVNVILIPNMQSFLVALGQDMEAAKHASDWYRIYAVSLPFFSLYMTVWRFLSAQNIMTPLLYSCFLACAVVLPISLKFLTAWYGFLGTAYAFLSFQVAQVAILLFIVSWFKPHTPETWPGLQCWREVLDPRRLIEFVSLSLGGMVARSEWVYWEGLGLIVGMIGVLPLSVHTIPAQIVGATLMCPFGIGAGLSIRMGILLPTNVPRTRLLVLTTAIIAAIGFFITSVLLYIFRYELFSIFTVEQEVIDAADGIWIKVCIFNFVGSNFATAVGIANGLGMQWMSAVVHVLFLWVLGIPITYCTSILQGHGLAATWTWIIAPYVGIDLSFYTAFLWKDWDAFSLEIQQREGMASDDDDDDDDSKQQTTKGDEASERTHLLMA